ncbi:MAG: glycine cleavage system protein GcvH [Clostridiales bacterium]|jgi:glycine cleavage system H protein|nr:glycine cleavage system protein GcvH [Clostridiales bacterium]
MRKELRFSATHEWVETDGGIAAVGVTDYAAEQMGDIVFVELPEKGAKIFAGKPFANIESVKAVSEIFSPVTGIVADINETLLDAPEAINADAQNVFIVKVKAESYADGLMSADEYEKLKK